MSRRAPKRIHSVGNADVMNVTDSGLAAGSGPSSAVRKLSTSFLASSFDTPDSLAHLRSRSLMLFLLTRYFGKQKNIRPTRRREVSRDYKRHCISFFDRHDMSVASRPQITNFDIHRVLPKSDKAAKLCYVVALDV